MIIIIIFFLYISSCDIAKECVCMEGDCPLPFVFYFKWLKYLTTFPIDVYIDSKIDTDKKIVTFFALEDIIHDIVLNLPHYIVLYIIYIDTVYFSFFLSVWK